MMRFAYDLDGVLAQAPPKEWFVKPWRRMSGAERKERQLALSGWYRVAPPLLVPDQGGILHIVTARKADQRPVTEWWLRGVFPNVAYTLSMLSEPRTLVNVIAHKARALQLLALQMGVTDFVEDNRAILRGLAKAAVPQKLWLFDHVNGMELFWNCRPLKMMTK